MMHRPSSRCRVRTLRVEICPSWHASRCSLGSFSKGLGTGSGGPTGHLCLGVKVKVPLRSGRGRTLQEGPSAAADGRENGLVHIGVVGGLDDEQLDVEREAWRVAAVVRVRNSLHPVGIMPPGSDPG
ncbi:hypothetical protein TWF696_008106 [Orbilia brochopaga]|uniref:Uncharacterized protein n=1 Tax=Orbilia brochopaga TaxID=3140254 RepID=A0AAV9UQK3_9PEZI